MFSKLGKYFSLLLIFMFIMTLTAEAFTAIRPEQLKDMGGKPPMTRAQRKARQREEQGRQEEFNEPTPEPTFVHEDNNNNNNGGASASGGSGDFVRPSETPTPEPTVDNDQIEREKRLKARKTTSLVTIIMFLLIVGGVVGWYCTRNVNFKKLKK